jgi:hypothetical protein
MTKTKKSKSKEKPGVPPLVERTAPDRRLTLSDVLLSPPRQVDQPQYEDLNGDVHMHADDAMESSIAYMIRIIVERDFELEGNNPLSQEDEYVELIMRNRELIRAVLAPPVAINDRDIFFGMFMSEKFGPDWRKGDVHLDNRAIIEGMRDAFLAGLALKPL